MAKEYLKIWFSDIETAHEFFEGNDKHLGEFMVNVYRSYAELPLNFQCKLVAKYFKTYSKQIEFIKKAKADGSKAHLQNTENQDDKGQTLEGGVQGVLQGGVLPPPPPTLEAKGERLNEKGERLNDKGEIIKEEEEVAVQNCTSTAPLLHLHSSSTVPLPFLQSSSTAPSIIRQERHTRQKRQKDNKDFIVPTFEEFFAYCEEKGFDHVAKRAFDYYSANDWKDNQNNPVKNWKLKLQSVWFDEQRNPKPITKPQQEPQEEKDDLDEYFYFRWIGLGNENWNFYKIKRSIMTRYFENEKEGGCIPECLDHLSFQRRKSANLCTPNFK